MPAQPWRWDDLAGPWFTNNIATLRGDGSDLRASWWTGEVHDGAHDGAHDHPVLARVETLEMPQGG